MEEISHHPLKLKMTNVFRKAHCSCICHSWFSRRGRRSSRDSLTEIKTVIQLHWHHGGTSRGKGICKGRMVFYSDRIFRAVLVLAGI